MPKNPRTPGEQWTDPATGRTVGIGRPGKSGHPLEPAGKDDPTAPLHAEERPFPVREDAGGLPPLQHHKGDPQPQFRAEVAPGGRRSLSSKGARTQPGTRGSTYRVRFDGDRWTLTLRGEHAPMGMYDSKADAVKAARKVAVEDLPSRLEILDKHDDVEAVIDFGAEVEA